MLKTNICQLFILIIALGSPAIYAFHLSKEFFFMEYVAWFCIALGAIFYISLTIYNIKNYDMIKEKIEEFEKYEK